MKLSQSERLKNLASLYVSTKKRRLPFVVLNDLFDSIKTDVEKHNLNYSKVKEKCSVESINGKLVPTI